MVQSLPLAWFIDFSFKESLTFAMLLLRVDPMNIVGVDCSASRSTSYEPLEK